jgi:hypothetical protein
MKYPIFQVILMAHFCWAPLICAQENPVEIKIDTLSADVYMLTGQGGGGILAYLWVKPMFL